MFHFQKNSLLHDSIAFQASSSPKHCAISSGAIQWDYQELSKKVTETSIALQSLKVKKASRVGLLFKEYAYAYQGMLGVLKSGACYVPLNTDFPIQRLVHVIEHSEMEVICCDTESLATWGKIQPFLKKNSIQILVVDALEKNTKVDWCDPCTTSDDIAYIMYTSGTTGAPKGVMISHRNVTAFLEWALSSLKLSEKDIFSHHSRMSFDLSVFDMFACFFAGGTLFPIQKPMDLAFPGSFFKKNKITVCLSVPSVIGMMIKSGQLESGLCESLRIYLVCGEALNPAYAKEWLKTHPAIPLYNIYGPTEATIACTDHLVKKEDVDKNIMPIGKAMVNSGMVVLQKNILNEWEDCPVGTIGELFITGEQLSKGYWKNKTLTNKVFLPHYLKPLEKMYHSGDLAKVDDAGTLFWMGRCDQQVQVQGFRVELSEIEGVLARSPWVAECAVIFDEKNGGKLVAICVLKKDSVTPKLIDLQKHCRQELPDYMSPKRLEIFDVLPKNSNGKIDRKEIKVKLKI